MYEGRPLWEMPSITARICGICPVSHLMASAKAGDQILAVRIPPAAEKLRRLMNLAQIIQSHSLSFFHLSAPDLLLGMDSDPAKRNILGLIAAEPELARNGIRLRQLGQQIIAALGGQKIHPPWCVPGGVRSPLSIENRDWIRSRIPESRDVALDAIRRFKEMLDKYHQEVQTFGSFPTMYLGLIAADGTWEHYDGKLRLVDSEGKTVADGIDPGRYREHFGEAAESWSYLKSPYYRPLGYPDGIYRVGSLARLNLCARMGTPLADKELAEFRRFGIDAVNSAFFYHYARLIEILTAVERIEQMVDDADLQSTHLRAHAGVNRLEGIGCCEAPRGTLFHHYQVNADGLIQKVNLLIATGQNNLAMNRAVLQIARHYIKGPHTPKATLNRLEAGIRAFDPCLSCSTHAAGQMPLHVQLLDAKGQLLSEVRRG
jgi:NAD-reducing hydrogenase large subunit